MRRLLLLPCAIAMLTAAGAAEAATGGAAAPSVNGAVTKDGGGTPYTKRRRARRRPSGPVLAAFSLQRERLFLFGSPARVSFRIRSRVPLARVRVTITRRGVRTPA